MTFSILTWIMGNLPVITGISWTNGWPDVFNKPPVGVFRLADDSVGVIIDAGEGSANVSIYIDTWAKTPEARETYDSLVIAAIQSSGMLRRMKRHTEEIWTNGTKAYRSTILFAGEYDHGMARMCTPR